MLVGWSEAQSSSVVSTFLVFVRPICLGRHRYLPLRPSEFIARTDYFWHAAR
jgi:hypothetical protein